MPKGFFLVIEGIDGSGKGTAIESIRAFLHEKGLGRNRVFLTREPSNSEYGLKARELLKSESDPNSKRKEALELFLKDRKEHIEKEIKPALEREKIVICDRYKYSTVAYQAAQGESIEELVGKNIDFLKPDLCIILDLPAEEAMKRIEKDSKRSSKEMFEKAGFLKKVRENFLKMPELFCDEEIVIVDVSSSREKVAEKIKSALEKELLLDNFK